MTAPAVQLARFMRAHTRAGCVTARRAFACAALAVLAGCSMIGVDPLPSPGRAPPATPAPPSSPSAPSGRAAQPPPGAPSPESSAPPSGATARTRNDASGATRELLTQSRAARAAGKYAQASAITERALRIDPNNGYLWLELGEIALANGETKQAETLARKALSLAAGDRSLTTQAERLLRTAGTR